MPQAKQAAPWAACLLRGRRRRRQRRDPPGWMQIRDTGHRALKKPEPQEKECQPCAATAAGVGRHLLSIWPDPARCDAVVGQKVLGSTCGRREALGWACVDADRVPVARARRARPTS
eukprot:365966-Chlamydomonas_euryale.AAC.8